ncbi:hypothetical protein D3C76_1467570 [compost metagenome]
MGYPARSQVEGKVLLRIPVFWTERTPLYKLKMDSLLGLRLLGKRHESQLPPEGVW